jgi:hypothetical protein
MEIDGQRGADTQRPRSILLFLGNFNERIVATQMGVVD